MRQILARSRHTLMMSENKWTDIQRHRVNILFKHYPILKEAYALAMKLRQIFNTKTNWVKAMKLPDIWFTQVLDLAYNSFRSVIKTIRNHYPTILNYFLRTDLYFHTKYLELKGKSILKLAILNKRGQPRL